MKKECGVCSKLRPLAEFNKNKSSSDGHRSKCRDCDRKYKSKNKNKIRNLSKEYYKKNSEIIKTQVKEYQHNNQEKIKVREQAYRKKNKEKISTRRKKYYDANQEALIEYGKKYRKQNKDKISEYKKEYFQKNKASIAKHKRIRYKEDIHYRLAKVLRNRLYHAVVGTVKAGSAIQELGCSIEELKAHLEDKFQRGMTWENYGEWHIDHIKPLAGFDLANLEQFKMACRYTNLQPLWAEENILKGAK